jgi:hypothetical protein
VVPSLVPAAAVGKEHGCVVVAATMAGTIAVDTVSDYPSTIVEDYATVLWVGYTPCGTLEKHR